MNKKQLAIIFNAWAAEYAANPEAFTGILDGDGKPFDNYGDEAAEMFSRIAEDRGFGGLVK